MYADERLTLLFLKARMLLEKYFTCPIDIKKNEVLSEPGRRNVLMPLALKAPLHVPQSVILKQSLPDITEAPAEQGEDVLSRFSRDWGSLELLNNIPSLSLSVPKFYGGDWAHRFILIEDFGQPHVSLVDTLTLSNKNKAIDALSRFMKSLGELHGATFQREKEYEMIFSHIFPKIKDLQEEFNSTLNNLLMNLKTAQRLFNLKEDKMAYQEAQNVIKSVLLPNPFFVLIHGDICPDNVFDRGELKTIAFIDFEWSSFRSALLDGTYLRMSMPTCWCAKAFPENLITSLEAIYRQELQKKIAAASNDTLYHQAYTEACAFWVLRTFTFLEKIMAKEIIGPSGPVPPDSLWNPDENFGRPRFLSRLSSFIEVAEKYALLPHLKRLATCMLKIAKEKWPEAKPLELYPVFKN